MDRKFSHLTTETVREQGAAVRNILIMTLEYPPKAGTGSCVLELIEGLAGAGYHVTVISPSAAGPATLRRSNTTAYLVAASETTSSKIKHSSTVQGILAMNEDLVAFGQTLITGFGWRPNVIHCHDWFTFPAARQLGRQFGIPVVGTAHYTSDPIDEWWGLKPEAELLEQERALFCDSDKLIVVSRSVGNLIQSVYGVPDHDIQIIYNGLDPAPFIKPIGSPEQIEKLRASIAAPHEKIILFAGRLTPQKGVPALFSSALRVIAEYPDVRYLLAGEPDSRDSADAFTRLRAQYPNIRDRIKLLGWVPRKQVAMLYGIADLVVIPSIYETFGYTALEAMASGTPVVATNVGGLAEIIRHGRTGLLTPVNGRDSGIHAVNVDKLAEAQLMLLKDEAFARRIAAAGQRHVLSDFTIERMVSSTIEVYRQVILEFQSGSDVIDGRRPVIQTERKP
jgi:glycosyltransferase involved in cell wall biosynthesis